MPDGEVVIMPGIGHLPMLEALRNRAYTCLEFPRRSDAA